MWYVVHITTTKQKYSVKTNFFLDKKGVLVYHRGRKWMFLVLCGQKRVPKPGSFLVSCYNHITWIDLFKVKFEVNVVF